MESYYYFFPTFPESGNSLYQFKITLSHPGPPIWRRVLVPGDYTFRDFHFVIQNAMGWSSTHLYKFNLKDHLTGEDIEVHDSSNLGGLPDHLGINNLMSESTLLRKYFKHVNNPATYDYDFDSPKHHIIHMEEILPADPTKKYPKCIAGERATPPEHGSPDETEGFDPERFDAKLITFLKCPDYFKDLKSEQSFSSDESTSDSSNVSKNSDKFNVSLIKKRSGNTSPEVARTSTSDSSDLSSHSDNYSMRKKSGNTLSEVPTTSTTKLVEQEIDNRQKVIDYLVTQNSNEADSSKLNQKRKAPEDNELKSVPAKLIVLENKDLQINSNTTLETTRIIENSEAEPSNSKGHAEDVNVSCVTEDAEDYYGRFIASQMRNIKDLERREDLRIKIQQLISEYRFKN